MVNRNIINVKIAYSENVEKYKAENNMLIHARTGNIKRLTVSSSNKDAINLYKDFGFLETGFDYIGNRLIMTLL